MIPPFHRAVSDQKAATPALAGPAWTCARGRARVHMADSKPRSGEAQSQLRPRA